MGRFPSIDETVVLNYESGGWATEGILTDPAANTVYADTGQLAAGIYDFEAYLAATAVMSAMLEHRNAANSATLKDQAFFVPAQGTSRISVRSYKLAVNERLRVFKTAAFVGSVQASIIYVQRVG